MSFAKPLHLRLFLEGLEVPVIAAQVSVHLNAPAAASIQIVPIDEGLRLKPRTMVHLFFLERPAILDENTDEQVEYRLLFTGETIGFSTVQRANGRSLILQCLDFSSYWDSALTTVINYGGNNFDHEAQFYGSNTAVFDNIINFEANKLVEWMKQKPETEGLAGISGLAGGAIRILEAVSGIRNKSKGVNDFFTIAELRCRILEQICAEENDNTALKIVAEKVFDEWIHQSFQSLGEQVSFRQVIELLMQYIYHDFVPNPTAKYDPALPASRTKPKLVSSTLMAETSNIRKILDDDVLNLKEPNINRAQATTMVGVWEASTGVIETLKKLNKTAATDAADMLSSLAATIKQDVNNNSLSADAFSKKLNSYAPTLQSARDKLNAKDTITKTQTTDGTTARLRSHILRPNCWMSPPPRCNVIFPEMYTDLTYDRTFIQEPTRMLLHFYSTIVGPEKILGRRILSPSSALAKILTNIGASYRDLMKHELHTGIVPRIDRVPDTAGPNTPDADAGKEVSKNQLEWGAKIQEFMFFKERFINRTVSVSGRFMPYVVCGFPSLVIRRPFITSLQTGDVTKGSAIDVVTDPSNEALLGAPSQLLGMIQSVSHSIGQDGGSTSLSIAYAREHRGADDEFLGLTTSITDPVVKRVSYIINYADVSRGDQAKLLDLLVDLTPQEGLPKSKSSSGVSSDVVTAEHPKTTYDPATGKYVTDKTIVTYARTRQGLTYDASLAPVTEGFIEGTDVKVLVPKGKTKKTPGPNTKGLYGHIVGVEVLDPMLHSIASTSGWVYAFHSVQIYEDVQLSKNVEKPVERILQPSWFSDNYHAENIGNNIYWDFFGTGSIIDDTEFKTPVGTIQNTSDMVDPMSEDPTGLKARLDKLDATGVSIEKSVNLLGYVYGVAKQENADIEEFIHNYTWRPIASMSDMLGYNLDFEVDSSTKLVPKNVDPLRPYKVGFHSHAVHEKAVNRITRMVGLVDDPTTSLHRLNGTDKAQAIANYDVRKEKWMAVWEYKVALTKGPGFRG
jgi:hypothetical protein